MGELLRENKMNFPINIENLGDLTPQERDEAIFRLGAEYGARAMDERFLQDLDASMKMKESDGKVVAVARLLIGKAVIRNECKRVYHNQREYVANNTFKHKTHPI